MKISKEKFEEFVSAYLDNEATPEEKIALSKCIMQDREMARIFYRECKIYAATCKIYGREPSLQKLDGIPNPLNPVKKKKRFQRACRMGRSSRARISRNASYLRCIPVARPYPLCER